MTKRSLFLYATLFAICLIFHGCKKSEVIPLPPATSITIEPSTAYLKRDLSFIGVRVTPTIKNIVAGESDKITWTSENTRIARVDEEGIVWPEGAGETYVVATLISGRGAAKLKIIVTDANDYKYRIILKDKGISEFTVGQPEKFLSAKAIQRRRNKNIQIDAIDLPISPIYIKEIAALGGTIVAKSKWLNTVTIHCTDQFLIDKYKALPFVKDVIMVSQSKRPVISTQKYVDVPQTGTNMTQANNLDYGTASANISVNNGQSLHQLGFKGAGIDIAVIDAGFINMKSNPAFKNISIKGAKSFVYENDDPYAVDNHGIWVTSCMAVNIPGKYVGTAPEANYWLFRTEVDELESPVEEDYWANAAEYADSVGVDIINSSLTYRSYTLYGIENTYEEMDGKTAMATRAANIAATKGILIFNCAGNETSWVGAPADSPSVLTVGSVNNTLLVSSFSSYGYTIDRRIKPDILALGGYTSVINPSGTSEYRHGTSYSSPIMCGLGACLWQAFPQLTNFEIMDILKKSSDRFANPVEQTGYGIPDMKKAYELGKVATSKK